MTEYMLQPVGVVHSPILKREDMPSEGVAARLEVFKEFNEALDGIDEYSHLIILLFLHQADRSNLKVRPRMGKLSLPEKGVFATRSPTRPNPIALNVVKVTSRDGTMLNVDALDAIDGTPIIDIKPYQTEWDCIFSAKRSDQFDVLQKMPRDEVLRSMMREASNFHGDACAGTAIGVRLAYKASEILRCDPKNHDLKIISCARACITDGVQASTAATGKRLKTKVSLDPSVTFQMNGRSLQITISNAKKFRQAEEVLTASDRELFAQIEETQTKPRK